MAKEILADGREVEGGATNVRGSIALTPNELRLIKKQMYVDFLNAKQEGKIGLSYTFDSWLRDSCNTLRTLRKYDIETEHKLGKISKAEFDALEEMRVKMDISDLDKYGIQHINPSFSQMVNNSAIDNRLLVPQHRKNIIKFKKDEVKI